MFFLSGDHSAVDLSKDRTEDGRKEESPYFKVNIITIDYERNNFINSNNAYLLNYIMMVALMNATNTKYHLDNLGFRC